MAPLWSTITLGTEFFVTAAVFTTLYRGYYKNFFSRYLAGFAIAYEVIFNITYMADRIANDHLTQATHFTPAYIAFAAFHGIFSLIMFVAILLFFGIAWRKYSLGENYFHDHPKLTLTFSICWAIALISGIVLYVVTYLM